MDVNGWSKFLCVLGVMIMTLINGYEISELRKELSKKYEVEPGRQVVAMDEKQTWGVSKLNGAKGEDGEDVYVMRIFKWSEYESNQPIKAKNPL